MDTINTCLATTAQYHTLAYYSHLVPISLGLLLSIFALIKTKRSKLSIVFFAFVFSFSIWLVSDLIQWVLPSYHWIYFLWSWTDYANLVFFAMGVYFFGVLARKRISLLEKVLLVLILLPLFTLAVTGHTVVGLDQAQCNAINNSFDVTYTNYADIAYCVLLVISFLLAWFKDKIAGINRVQAITVGLSMLAFLLTFGITNYIAAQVAQYQINLYGLFVLPVFLIIMAFTISNLGLFQLRFLGTQLLVYVLMIIVGSQLFFIQSTSGLLLIIITVLVTLVISYLLLRNTNREIDDRAKIEKLAGELEAANKGQENLIHVMNHQVKGKFGNNRIVFNEILHNPDFGPLPDEVKKLLQQGFDDSTAGIDYVQNILKGASAQSGTLPYSMSPMDLKPLVLDLTTREEVIAEKQGLSLNTDISEGDYRINGDASQLREAFRNLIENAIKYNNPNGKIMVTLSRTGQKIIFAVKDTGRGIAKDDEAKLFTPGGVGKDSMKYNVESSGFGLAFVKPVVEKHKGRVWYKSNSPEKGTTFFVELPVTQ